LGLKLNGTHQLLTYADVDLQEDSIGTVIKTQKMQISLVRRLV
jgi:hypothetical protein